MYNIVDNIVFFTLMKYHAKIIQGNSTSNILQVKDLKLNFIKKLTKINSELSQ